MSFADFAMRIARYIDGVIYLMTQDPDMIRDHFGQEDQKVLSLNDFSTQIDKIEDKAHADRMICSRCENFMAARSQFAFITEFIRGAPMQKLETVFNEKEFESKELKKIIYDTLLST